MAFTVTLALLIIIPIAIVLFDMFSAPIAIMATYVLGCLFLPIASISITGLPDLDKVSATNLAVLIGAAIYHGSKLVKCRPSLLDVPIVLWCLAPGLSTLSNDLGPYEAFSETFRQVLYWYVPFHIGRVFFGNTNAMKQLGVAFIIGALVYIPFCLYEIRMSPQLHEMVYGFRQNQFWRNLRFDGYRPVVFMQSGLMLGIWMATATAISFWFWQTKFVERIVYVPIFLVFVILLVMTFLCKALYAILLLMAVLGILIVARQLRTAIPMLILLAAIPTYMLVRTTNVLPRSLIVGEVAEYFSERARSLDARLSQEDLFAEHALKRPIFGWAGWNRSWPYDDYLEKHQVRGVDGLWVITLGENGIFGVVAFFATLLLPILGFVGRFPPRRWNEEQLVPVSVLAVIVLLFACDCLLNSMYNPIFLVICGALVSFEVSGKHSTEVSAAMVRRRLSPGSLAITADLETVGP